MLIGVRLRCEEFLDLVDGQASCRRRRFERLSLKWPRQNRPWLRLRVSTLTSEPIGTATVDEAATATEAGAEARATDSVADQVKASPSQAVLQDSTEPAAEYSPTPEGVERTPLATVLTARAVRAVTTTARATKTQPIQTPATALTPDAALDRATRIPTAAGDIEIDKLTSTRTADPAALQRPTVISTVTPADSSAATAVVTIMPTEAFTLAAETSVGPATPEATATPPATIAGISETARPPAERTVSASATISATSSATARHMTPANTESAQTTAAPEATERGSEADSRVCHTGRRDPAHVSRCQYDTVG